jgi:hypothetical protein
VNEDCELVSPDASTRIAFLALAFACYCCRRHCRSPFMYVFTESSAEEARVFIMIYFWSCFELPVSIELRI